MTPTIINQLNRKNMDKFIKLHKEIRESSETVVVNVNIEHITHVYKHSNDAKYTFVGLTGTFVEVTESPQEVMFLVSRCGHPY